MALPSDKIPTMKVQLYSTRVKAPNLHPVSASSVYDDATSKPSGRVESDSCSKTVTKPHFIKRKNIFQLSTLNTRTINPLSRKHELVSSALHHHNDIICIQEHRQHHLEALRVEHINTFQLITASATKNSVNASVGGVGFLLSPRAQKSLLSVDKISSRITILHINGNPRLSVICCYSPTNCSDDDVKADFYRSLSRAIASVPRHNMLAVCGDFNAKIANNTCFSYHTATNDNGERMLELLQEHQLIVTNTRFQKPSSKLWTYEDPKRSRHQIDFILWRKKWANSLKNCQAYNTMQTVGSDHRIVTCFVQASYRVNKTPPSDPLRKVDWSYITNNTQLSYDYPIEVNNRYSVLLQEHDTDADYSLL